MNSFAASAVAAAADEQGHAYEPIEPISVPERLGAVLLIGASLLVGIYPHVLLKIIVPSFDSPLFQWIQKGGAQ